MVPHIFIAHFAILKYHTFMCMRYHTITTHNAKTIRDFIVTRKYRVPVIVCDTVYLSSQCSICDASLYGSLTIGISGRVLSGNRFKNFEGSVSQKNNEKLFTTRNRVK